MSRRGGGRSRSGRGSGAALRVGEEPVGVRQDSLDGNKNEGIR